MICVFVSAGCVYVANLLLDRFHSAATTIPSINHELNFLCTRVANEYRGLVSLIANGPAWPGCRGLGGYGTRTPD